MIFERALCAPFGSYPAEWFDRPRGWDDILNGIRVCVDCPEMLDCDSWAKERSGFLVGVVGGQYRAPLRAGRQPGGVAVDVRGTQKRPRALICDGCGERFVGLGSPMSFKGRCVGCGGSDGLDRWVAARVGAYDGNQVLLECVICGDDFRGKRDRKTCGVRCREISRQKMDTLRARRRKSIPDMKKCVWCGNMFRNRQGNHLVCGDKCRVERNRERWRENKRRLRAVEGV